MKFEGKVVFITGGASGIGNYVAKSFKDEGATVLVGDFNQEAVDVYNTEFAGHGKAYTMNVADYEGVEAVAEQVFAEYKKIDVLYNCAGVTSKVVPLDKLRMSDFDRCIDINLKGTFYVTFAFGKRMKETGGGRIIDMCTTAAYYGDKGMLPYSVSKIGLTTLTHNIAYEWGNAGITTVAIAPSFVGAGMNAKAVENQDFVDFMSSQNPMGELMGPDAIRDLIFFLSSPESKFINGETINIDAGMTGYTATGFMDYIAAKKAEKNN